MAETESGLKAAAKGLEPKIVKVSEELSCELNEVEWQNRARELAEAHKEVARQEDRRKTVMAGLANDVKIAKAKESKLADVVATRSEQREVTVEVKYDYELGTVTKVRTDTDEVISEREMTDNERQAELELNASVIDANDAIEARHNDEEISDDEDAGDLDDLDVDDLDDDEEGPADGNGSK